MCGQSFPADARSGPDGRFLFRNVPAGTYVLQVSGPSRSFASQTIAVDAAPVIDLVPPLRAGVAARGRIVFDGDAAPPPPDRVRVTLRRIEFVNGPVGGGPPPSRTNADWTFDLSGLTGVGMLRVDPPPPWRLGSRHARR